jgi:hypothetical protein
VGRPTTAVAPTFRGQGLGRLLYQRFIEVVARHGRRGVRAITALGNIVALAFHRRLGFRVALSDENSDDARAELVLELPQPSSVASEGGHAAAAALDVPLTGTLIALEPLARRHGEGLAAAATMSDWSLGPVVVGRRRLGFGIRRASTQASIRTPRPRRRRSPPANLERRLPAHLVKQREGGER